MNTVKIHGFLSKIFGSTFKIYINKFRSIIDAIDCIKHGFRKKLIELQSKGFYFSIEKGKNQIDIIPLITGSSRTALIIVAVVIIVIAIIYGLYTQDWYGAFQIACFGLGILYQVLTFKPQKPRDVNSAGSTGGLTYSQSNSKSYVFSNLQNLAHQGNLVRFGYGKYLSGSSLINVSVINYSTNETFQTANNFAFNEPEDSKFSQEFDPNKSTNLS